MCLQLQPFVVPKRLAIFTRESLHCSPVVESMFGAQQSDLVCHMARKFGFEETRVRMGSIQNKC